MAAALAAALLLARGCQHLPLQRMPCPVIARHGMTAALLLWLLSVCCLQDIVNIILFMVTLKMN
jgi:hypothetical protein